MKSRENTNHLKRIKSMLFVSLIFLYFVGYLSAFGTKKRVLAEQTKTLFVFKHFLVCLGNLKLPVK